MSQWRSSFDGSQIGLLQAQKSLTSKIDRYNLDVGNTTTRYGRYMAEVDENSLINVHWSITSGHFAGRDLDFQIPYGLLESGIPLDELIYKLARTAAIRGGLGLGKITKADVRSSVALLELEKDGYVSL